MRSRFLTIACGLVLLGLSGCTTRSISDSGYGRDCARADNPFYQGELSEFDVLGIERSAAVNDADIAAALSGHQPVGLRPGASLMVVQSGALIPDEEMLAALAKNYSVGFFSGQPPKLQEAGGAQQPSESFAKALRLAAARGGHEKLLIYWGVLESGQENLATRSVSWVPVVGWVLPDQRQRMRIRLKITLIDVRTGSWDMFAPEPIEDRAVSSMVSRGKADQGQVQLLKSQAYPAAVAALVARYGAR